MSKKVLHIIGSPRGAESLSRKLGNIIVEKIRENDPDTVVKERILAEHSFPHVEEVHIAGFFTPEEMHTPEQNEAIKNSNEAVGELQEADTIVISLPMHNFSITSGLKAYFDHIARVKLTFQYHEAGWEGLLKNKKAYIAISSGGVFDNEQWRPYDFAIPYMKHFLGFIGITDVTVFRAEGSGIPELQESVLDKAIDIVNAHAFNV